MVDQGIHAHFGFYTRSQPEFRIGVQQVDLPDFLKV